MKKMNVNVEARFLPTKEACRKFNICRASVMRLAEECNAIIRIGRTVRIDADLLEKHIQDAYRG